MDHKDFLMMGIPVNTTPPLLAPSRPVRLFQVSYAKRKVGGMFVEEIGSSYFSQADLVSRGVFILDSGSTHLWIWIASGEITPEEIKLAIQVAVEYSSNISLLPSYKLTPEEEEAKLRGAARTQAAKSHASEGIAIPRMKSIAKGGTGIREVVECPAITIQIVVASQETPAFKDCFFGWNDTESSPSAPLHNLSTYREFLLDNITGKIKDEDYIGGNEFGNAQKAIPTKDKSLHLARKRKDG